jgi:hypothetical protein
MDHEKIPIFIIDNDEEEVVYEQPYLEIPQPPLEYLKWLEEQQQKEEEEAESNIIIIQM